ncbi:MAG: GNAT family N-acetyltransferase [Mangrovicoccus sp.]|nr:GNAT family N-acetyltransferase [Mangrovicoccus sp.]
MSYSETRLHPIVYCVASAQNKSAQALINKSGAALTKATGEADFALTAQDLDVPNCHILMACDGPQAVGCIVLMDELHYGEIAHLYLRPEARGRGISRGLLIEVENLASELGLRVLRVKTCANLVETLSLYRAQHYADCPAFGGHPRSRAAVFLEKHLL